jgi:hypothetical protein
MTDQANEQAGTPAGTEAEGIIDLDAGTAQEAVNDIESGELNVEDDATAKTTEETPDAAAEAKKAADAEAKTKLSGAQRAKIREQALRDEIAARDRELEALRKAPAEKAGARSEGAEGRGFQRLPGLHGGESDL